MIAYIALGSNHGDRAAHLRRALEALPAAGVRPLRLSVLRSTAPVGATGRARFLNAVAEVETALPPQVLLARLRQIERAAGRHRSRPAHRKTPRALDLDLILYGNARLRTPALTVPHPAFSSRRFVLDGLVDLAPGLRPPATALTVRQLLRRA